jgi:hypothetical protein
LRFKGDAQIHELHVSLDKGLPERSLILRESLNGWTHAWILSHIHISGNSNNVAGNIGIEHDGKDGIVKRRLRWISKPLQQY